MKKRFMAGMASSILFLAGAAEAKDLCSIVVDAASGKVIHQKGTACDERIAPASTFKIPLSLMGYDSGYLSDTALPSLPYHEGDAAWIASWKEDTNPTAWMKNSVVWYSQRLTEWLGEERFRNYVESFSYGNRDVSGDPGKNNGLTRAWLSSSLKISPLEQADFLQKLVNRRLPVSTHAYDMTERLVSVGSLADGWEAYGKTGMGYPVKADGSRDEKRPFGWFVGWAKQKERTVVFVHIVQDDKKEKTYASLRAKEGILKELPSILKQ